MPDDAFWPEAPVPQVLSLTSLPPPVVDALLSRYLVTFADTVEKRKAILERGSSAEAVITNGGVGMSADQIAAMPHLKLIATIGVGAEAVDHEAAARRGIAVVNGRGTLENGVADHALALLLALTRNIPALDRAVRNGAPRPIRPPDGLTGKRMGVLGLGEIGLRIARRAEAFGLVVDYHNRKPRPDVPYAYHPDVRSLASASDFLVVACPGGEATRRLVDAPVLAALGPQARLINIGRGSVVDTEALIAALHNGVIAGAALDVFEGEPTPSPALAAAPHLILTPHVAAASPERIVAMGRRLIEAIDLHLQTPAIPGALS